MPTAAAVLRLLLQEEPADAACVDWDAAWPVAVRNNVGVRVAERLVALGIPLPARGAAALAAMRERNQAVTALIGRIAETCRREQIGFLFPKAFQHWPDMGQDIDLVVDRRSLAVDRVLLGGLTVTRTHHGLRHRIAGSVAYEIAGCDAPLEIHHGRLGVLGEHRELPDLLLRRSRATVIDGISIAVLPPGDQLLLQGLQRVHGRRSIRISDVVSTVRAVRHGALGWEGIVATARRFGFAEEMGCYLGYVEQIHRDVLDGPLLPKEVASALPLHGWGRAELHGAVFRLPVARVHRRLYTGKLRAAAAGRDWQRIGRLCLAPVVATAALASRASR